MIKRVEYLDGMCNWFEYNSQFVTDELKKTVAVFLEVHGNPILSGADKVEGISIEEWDDLCLLIFGIGYRHGRIIGDPKKNALDLYAKFRECGSWPNVASLVMVLQAAAYMVEGVDMNSAAV